MGYVCAKRMKLGGREFLPGEAIPDGAFAGGRQDKLVSYGYVTELKPEGVPELAGVEAVPVSLLTVMLDGKETAVSSESLQSICGIMRKNAKDAAEAIAEEVDESVLSFVGYCDSRRDVQRAVQKQLAVIASLKGGADIPETDGNAEDEAAKGEGAAEEDDAGENGGDAEAEAGS